MAASISNPDAPHMAYVRYQRLHPMLALVQHGFQMRPLLAGQAQSLNADRITRQLRLPRVESMAVANQRYPAGYRCAEAVC
jgi:hypothetical protein